MLVINVQNMLNIFSAFECVIQTTLTDIMDIWHLFGNIFVISFKPNELRNLLVTVMEWCPFI